MSRCSLQAVKITAHDAVRQRASVTRGRLALVQQRRDVRGDAQQLWTEQAEEVLHDVLHQQTPDSGLSVPRLPALSC